MQIFWEIIHAQAAAGLNITETVTLPIQPPPGAKVLGRSLVTACQSGENGQAEVGISTYIQNGQSNGGNWPVIDGENITSAVAYLRVASAQATATIVMFLYE